MKQLPLQCEAYYLENFLSEEEAAILFSEILSVFDVTNKHMTMADGSVYTAETATYIFTDEEYMSFDAIHEVWGGRSLWTPLLARVREQVREQTGVNFQVARCVYYKDGTEGVSFHRDLPAYGSTSQIASISLGAVRDFEIRNISGDNQPLKVGLASGSLLFMGDGFQDLYEHGLPLDEGCSLPRLNLTFRRYGWD